MNTKQKLEAMLPTLTGSYDQVQWARNIRIKQVYFAREAICSRFEADFWSDALDLLIKIASQNTNAAHWIGNRGDLQRLLKAIRTQMPATSLAA